jgi:hypothetical protein
MSPPQRTLPPRAERLAAASSALGGSVAGALWLLPTLTRGGLAPVALAGAIALGVGGPAALAEWRTPPEADPARRETATSLAELGGLVIAACALASLAHGSPLGLVAALLAWPLGAVVAARPGWLGLPALLATVALAALAAVRSAGAPPWTLLQPEWSGWPQFLAPALIGGLWLAGAGTGRWSLGATRPPGALRAPLASVGVGIALATALAVDRGSLYEASLGASTASPWTDALVGVAAVSLAGATAYSPRSGGRRWVRPLAGFVATAVFAATGDHVQPWVWDAVGPAVTAALLAATAIRASGVDRTAAGAGALVAGAAAALGWPGWPGRVLDAVLVGAMLVTGFWFVATRSVLARRAT